MIDTVKGSLDRTRTPRRYRTADARRVGQRRASVFVGFAVAIAVGGCGDDGGASAERFCGEVDANRTELTSPSIQFSDDVEPFLDLYRSIGELAPLSIEAEWDQLTSSYETASTIVPGDPESEQLAIATALQSEKAAAAVDRWLQTNCGVQIGPLNTLVGHES